MLPSAIIIAAAMLSIAIIYKTGSSKETVLSKSKVALQEIVTGNDNGIENTGVAVSLEEETVAPSAGVELPIVWGDLGLELIRAGAIDEIKWRSLYESRGMFSGEYERLLLGENDRRIKITGDNAGYLLNLFWALGLAQSNPILIQGEMMDKRYGGPQNFASTGGWTIAKGNPMDHYSRHAFFTLTDEQQTLVEKVSENIYRPCCGNSTHFPDCNHGLAMLGMLELMASQGVGEEEMYKAALAVNSYWFPDQYATIARYLGQKGIDWQKVIPKTILGADFSSGQGFAKIAAQVTQPVERNGGGGCGVDDGQPITVPVPRQESGCGV